VLNLCCGQGRHVLEFCRRGFGKVECRVLPYVAETFNAVWILGNSFGYFASAEDDCAMLREAHRVLRPAGRLLLDVTDGEYLNPLRAALVEWIDATMFVCRERELSTDGDTVLSHVRL
jgi:D-alanine-D-alanine ligase